MRCKALLLGLVSLGLCLAGGQVSAQAASQAVKLPTSLRGVWYGYAGKLRVKGQRSYQIARITLKGDRVTMTEYVTPKKSLKALKWQDSYVMAAHYVKKAKGVYQVKARVLNGGTLMTISRRPVKVKALGQKRSALKMTDSGGSTYAFRQPLLSHVWKEGWLN